MANNCICGCGKITKYGQYSRGHSPNSRNGFNKHNNRNSKKRIETSIKRYGKVKGRPKGMKHTDEAKKLMSNKIKEYYKHNRHPNYQQIKILCKYCKKEFVGYKTRITCSNLCNSKQNWSDKSYIEKNRKSHLGIIPWNKGMKGMGIQVNWRSKKF